MKRSKERLRSSFKLPQRSSCVDALIDELAISDFLFTELVVRNAIRENDFFQLLDKSESLKLDVYPRELIPGELQRSQSLELFDGIFLPVVSRVDAALSKLIWIDKGSQRSRRDFRGIFRNCQGTQQALIRTKAAGVGYAGYRSSSEITSPFHSPSGRVEPQARRGAD